jgi:hemerythrin
MSLLVWQDAYSIGNELIDGHHKKLFDIFNMLYTSNCGTDHGKSDYYCVLDELIYYADYHFEAEEQIMIDNNYVDTDNHVARHKYFIESVMSLKQADGLCADEIGKGTINFLGKWLLLHVTKEDKKLAVYF